MYQGRACPECGDKLDPEERCDCVEREAKRLELEKRATKIIIAFCRDNPHKCPRCGEKVEYFFPCRDSGFATCRDCMADEECLRVLKRPPLPVQQWHAVKKFKEEATNEAIIELYSPSSKASNVFR